MSELPPNSSYSESDPDADKEQRNDILKVADLVGSGGDINSAAIRVQQSYGVDVGPAWWQEHVTEVVGEGASPEQMAAAFDAAFPEFLESQKK